MEEEGVVHLARRMAFREIQLGEVVVVGLDVGTFGDRESHVGEDRGQLVPDLAQRMDAAGLSRRIAQRQGDVDGLGRKPRIERRRFQHVAPRGERLGDLVLGLVDRGALRLALVRRHLAERRKQGRDRALLAEGGDAHGFERGFVAGGGDLVEDGLFRALRGRTRSNPCSKFGCGCRRPKAVTSSEKPVISGWSGWVEPFGGGLAPSGIRGRLRDALKILVGRLCAVVLLVAQRPGARRWSAWTNP